MNPINKPAAPAVGWQQARVLEMQAEYADAFDTQTGSYDEMCAAYGEERKMWNSGGPEMEETIEYQIPYEGYTVPVRLLRPVKAEKLPVIFFMHGGGFVEGDNDTHRKEYNISTTHQQRKLWSAKRKATAALLRNAQHAKLLFRI